MAVVSSESRRRSGSQPVVLFQDAAPISVPDIPPGVPPRPTGGVETDAESTSLLWDGSRGVYYVSIVVKPGEDRDVTGVRIESITDLEGGGKDDKAPAPHNEYDLGSSWDPNTRTYTLISESCRETALRCRLLSAIRGNLQKR